MLHRRYISRLVLIVMLSVVVIFAPQLQNAVQSVFAASTVYADGYYDSSGGAKIFGGARADMESAVPQIRDGGSSVMRVAVKHTPLSDPIDVSFAETGWTKLAGDCVYASWRDINYVEGFYITTTCLTDVVAHDYRVAVKNDNQTQWSFIFDGVVFKTAFLGFTRAAEVGCGGEASSSQNAIGVAGCLNVRYKNNNLTSWVYLPSHLKRVSSGYRVIDINSYSWQSSGNN
jgi:hypothetical protein